MGNNIVVLSGSPRKGGNTDKLTAAFIEGAESAGKSVTCFRPADMNISGCRGCGHCFKETGVCVQKDDMRQILDALRKADTLVIASPVYYFGVTAQLKLAIDRTYATLKERLPVRQAALLVTCGADTDAASPTVAMFRHISALQKWAEAGVIVAPRLHGADEINGRAELEEARKLGREI
jgi:multimeric flavodoxin WrbA